jgi:hypothetical protein
MKCVYLSKDKLEPSVCLDVRLHYTVAFITGCVPLGWKPKRHILTHTQTTALREAIFVRSRGGPYSCLIIRFPHFPHNRLTDSAGRTLASGRFLVLISAILDRPQGYSAVGRNRSTEKSSDLKGNRIRHHPTCSMVPQPATLPRASNKFMHYVIMFMSLHGRREVYVYVQQ